MKKILLIFAFIFAFMPRVSGQTGQIGTGTGTSVYLPIYSYYGYNYSQQIYTSAEMTTAVGTNNLITAIRFYVNTSATPQTNFNTWKVYMGNTTQASYATATNWVPLANLQEVYSATLPAMTSGNWVEIPLATPFIWDGTSNVVIAVNESSPGYSDYPGQAWGTYNAGTNRGILYYEDGANPNPASPPSASNRYADIPRVQLVASPLVACGTTPPLGVAVGNTTATTANVSWTPTTGATYVLRYRLLPGGAWTSVNINTPLASNYLITGLTELSQYEVQLATVCAGTTGAFSAGVTFNTTAIAWCPHSAQYTSAIYGWISNVTVNPIGSTTLNNTSAQSQYTDYSANPAQQLTLVRGTQNNPLSIGKTWSGTQYGNYAQVWIDFDRSGTFEPAEKVYDSGLSTAANVSGVFNVPAVTYNGPNATKMRVILSYSSTTTACNGTNYGEIEDYAVKFIDPVACTSAAPTNLGVSNITSVSAMLSWMPAQGATYLLQWKPVASATWNTVSPNPTVSSYTLTGLNESVQYEFRVAYICSGTTGTFSTPLPFTTPAISWCPHAAQFTSAIYGWISNVTVSPIGSTPVNNTSTQSQYTNFSANPALQVTLVRGTQNNPISIGKTWSGTAYGNYAQVWIDFDRSGTFEASEKVYDSGLSTATPAAGTFNVPLVTYNGPNATRMRVILSYASSTTACSGTTYGEVEDYAVRFIDPVPCTSAAPTNLSVSNLTPTSAILSWMPAQGATYIVQWKLVTATVWNTITPNPTVSSTTLTGLTEQVQYEFRVAYICSGTQGTYSTPVQFTTPQITYCTSIPTSTFVYEHMTNVTITPTGLPQMVSASPQAPPPFYSDYSADPARLVTLIRGTSGNSISVTRAWPGTLYSSISKAWIDYNRNGVFEDSEVIINSPSNTNALATNTFTTPAAGSPQMYMGTLNVRMRVILSETSTSPNPCGTFSYGEVEDYSVKFIDLQPCSTVAPVPVVSNLTSSSAYVSWMPTANATYRIRWRQGTAGVWQLQPLGYVELPAGQSFYTITGLLEQTGYQVQIQAKCGTTWGAFGASIDFTTPSLTYCSMVGSGTIDHISNVKVTPVNFPVMDNTSVQTNYISYTTPATLINLEIGSIGNQISVSKAWAGSTSTFADAVDVYIDWNRDGVFATTERIMNSASSTTTPVTATFNVPATVYTGNYNTTMRVILRRGSTPVLCQDPANGEVEDYAVKLRPCATTTPTNVTTTLITQNSATIGWTSALNNNSFVFEYRAVTSPASPWITIQASTIGGNPPVLLTGLVPATLYEVRIAAKCGAGTLGAYTPIKQFTTRCDPTPPNVTVTNVTSTSAVVTWNPIVPSATYLVRYRVVGTTTWINVTAPAPPANSVTLTGLSSYVTYEVQVANQCVGEITPNPWSNPQVFTTVRVCEIAPPGLTITTLTPTSAEVVWDAFTGAGATGSYILRYRKVGIPSWTTINVNTNTYTLTGLLELTKYEMQVANVCSGTPGNFTPPYYFTTPTVVYCQMSSTTGSIEFINKVTVKPNGKPEMINETLGSSYSDFTSVPAKYIEMIQGSTGNQITVDKTVGTSVTGVAVWIDFNRNGSFDLNERILAEGPNINPTATATFNVPADAFVSMTDYKYVRMRVAMQKDGIPVNCVNFQNGEVEDYTVRISKPGVANAINQTDILIYPNPVSTVLNVKNISKKASYKIYSAAGQMVSSGFILNNKIDVSRLINGVYVIDIEDAQGTAQKKFIKE